MDRMFGPRFESALTFACSRHHGQTRKGNGAAYITHPMAVASLVGEYGGDEDQAIAGLLHDVMEDCAVTEKEIADRYGKRVASIVEACTDTTVKPKPAWRERKEKYIAKLRSKDPDVKLVVACDKMHNASSILRDLGRASVGQAVWGRFNASRSEVLWYYRSMVEGLREGWDHEVVDELDRIVQALEASAADSTSQ